MIDWPIPTTWRFDVSNAAVLVPVMQEVLVFDENNDPVYTTRIVWVNGIPTFVQGPQATTWVEVLDENGDPVLETVYRDLVFFVRKQDISELDALAAFHTCTSNAHPSPVQSLYEPTEEQWNEDWANGIGTFFDVP